MQARACTTTLAHATHPLWTCLLPALALTTAFLCACVSPALAAVQPAASLQWEQLRLMPLFGLTAPPTEIDRLLKTGNMQYQFNVDVTSFSAAGRKRINYNFNGDAEQAEEAGGQLCLPCIVHLLMRRQAPTFDVWICFPFSIAGILPPCCPEPGSCGKSVAPPCAEG